MQREPGALRPVEHLEHAERALLDEQRHGHDPLRHVAGLLGDLLRVPRILGQILDHERLAGDERPAGDAGARRDPRADQTLFVLAGDRLEDELVGLLVEEEDRRALGREDRARDLDDRPQQRAVGGVGADHAGRDGGSEPVLAHVVLRSSHVVGDQVQHALQLVRRQLGMLRAHERADPGHVRRREAVPGRADRLAAHPRQLDVDAAREELDRRVRVVDRRRQRVRLRVAADGDDGREPPRIALDRHVVRRRDEDRAVEVRLVRELVQHLGELALRRREAHVHDVEALLDRPAQAAEQHRAGARVAGAEHARRCGSRTLARARGSRRRTPFRDRRGRPPRRARRSARRPRRR